EGLPPPSRPQAAAAAVHQYPHEPGPLVPQVRRRLLPKRQKGVMHRILRLGHAAQNRQGCPVQPVLLFHDHPLPIGPTLCHGAISSLLLYWSRRSLGRKCCTGLKISPDCSGGEAPPIPHISFKLLQKY